MGEEVEVPSSNGLSSNAKTLIIIFGLAIGIIIVILVIYGVVKGEINDLDSLGKSVKDSASKIFNGGSSSNDDDDDDSSWGDDLESCLQQDGYKCDRDEKCSGEELDTSDFWETCCDEVCEVDLNSSLNDFNCMDFKEDKGECDKNETCYFYDGIVIGEEDEEEEVKLCFNCEDLICENYPSQDECVKDSCGFKCGWDDSEGCVEIEGCDVEGKVQSCGTNKGECTFGNQLCKGGVWTKCVDAQGIPVVLRGDKKEVCDGLDNDCDGDTDERLIAPEVDKKVGVCEVSLLELCDGTDFGEEDEFITGCDESDECWLVGGDCINEEGECYCPTDYESWSGVCLEILDRCDEEEDCWLDDGYCSSRSCVCPRSYSSDGKGACKKIQSNCRYTTKEDWIGSGFNYNLVPNCRDLKSNCDRNIDLPIILYKTCDEGVWKDSYPVPNYETVETSCFDELDNDCNGEVDGASCITVVNGGVCNVADDCGSRNCYLDEDGDRYANASGVKICQADSQLVGTDCDDTNNAIYPGSTFSTPSPDGLDNDCDDSEDYDGIDEKIIETDYCGGSRSNSQVRCGSSFNYYLLSDEANKRNSEISCDSQCNVICGDYEGHLSNPLSIDVTYTENTMGGAIFCENAYWYNTHSDGAINNIRKEGSGCFCYNEISSYF